VAFSSIADVCMIDLPRYSRADGEVVIAEMCAQVPFSIVRMYMLRGPLGGERGKHAHRLCSQLMICVYGAIEIVCDDGKDQRSFMLDRHDRALFVPPTLWNTVIFRQPEAALAVLCDRIYEDADYVRYYSDFLAWRKAGGS
jgi:dTDP-4-dehydrorhamnose 3,5-epimerase-like enzyme